MHSPILMFFWLFSDKVSVTKVGYFQKGKSGFVIIPEWLIIPFVQNKPHTNFK